MTYPIAHPNVMQRAKAVLELQPIFLDTETTGTGPTDRIIQLGIVDDSGNTLFESLVNPEMPIPSESSAVNGITDEMVKDAPVWTQIWSAVESVLKGRVIGIYNAEFDLRLLRQTNKAYGLPTSIESSQTFCVMKLLLLSMVSGTRAIMVSSRKSLSLRADSCKSLCQTAMTRSMTPA